MREEPGAALQGVSLLRRLPTPVVVAHEAASMASDRTSAMTAYRRQPLVRHGRRPGPSREQDATRTDV